MSTRYSVPVVHGNISNLHETKCEIELDWKINDVLSHLNINSPPFTWSAAEWRLSMTTGNDAGQIRLSLNKLTSKKKIPVVYKFGIQKRDGTTEVRCMLTKTFFSPISWGTHEFILLTELVERQHELLPDGILTLSCSVAHMDTLTKPQKFESKCVSYFYNGMQKYLLSFPCASYTFLMIILMGRACYSIQPPRLV